MTIHRKKHLWMPKMLFFACESLWIEGHFYISFTSTSTCRPLNENWKYVTGLCNSFILARLYLQFGHTFLPCANKTDQLIVWTTCIYLLPSASSPNLCIMTLFEFLFSCLFRKRGWLGAYDCCTLGIRLLHTVLWKVSCVRYRIFQCACIGSIFIRKLCCYDRFSMTISLKKISTYLL